MAVDSSRRDGVEKGRGQSCDIAMFEYFIRSTVLGGEVVSDLKVTGDKQRSYVIAGGTKLAEMSYRYTFGPSQTHDTVNYFHHDAAGMSQRVTRNSPENLLGTDSNYPNYTDPRHQEYDPSGGNTGTTSGYVPISVPITEPLGIENDSNFINGQVVEIQVNGMRENRQVLISMARAGVLYVSLGYRGGLPNILSPVSELGGTLFWQSPVFRGRWDGALFEPTGMSIEMSSLSLSWSQPQTGRPPRGPSPVEPGNAQMSCADALKQAGKTAAGLARAQAALPQIFSLVEDINLARLLAAIGIQESDFLNVNQIGGGPGRGVYQIEPKTYGIKEAEANNLADATLAIGRNWSRTWLDILNGYSNGGYDISTSLVQYYALAGLARVHNRGRSGVVTTDRKGNASIGTLLDSATVGADMNLLDNSGPNRNRSYVRTANGTYVKNVMDLFFSCLGG